MTQISKLLILTFLFFLSNGCESNKPYSEFTLPIHPKAEKIKKEFSKFPKGKLIQYQIKVEFPANEVIEFYDKAISKLGYEITPYNPKSDRKWTLFSQRKLEFVEVKSKPAHYSSHWADKDKTNEFVITLNYPKPDSKHVYIICAIQPYINIKKVDEFFKKLDHLGESEAFHKLLKKYENKDKSIKMKKALRENPDNKFLQEYKDLLTGKIK